MCRVLGRAVLCGCGLELRVVSDGDLYRRYLDGELVHELRRGKVCRLCWNFVLHILCRWPILDRWANILLELPRRLLQYHRIHDLHGLRCWKAEFFPRVFNVHSLCRREVVNIRLVVLHVVLCRHILGTVDGIDGLHILCHWQVPSRRRIFDLRHLCGRQAKFSSRLVILLRLLYWDLQTNLHYV